MNQETQDGSQDAITEVMIAINGELRQVPAQLSMWALFEYLGYEPRLIAVEYNGEILPRQAWPETLVCAGDVLELVTMVGGG